MKRLSVRPRGRDYSRVTPHWLRSSTEPITLQSYSSTLLYRPRLCVSDDSIGRMRMIGLFGERGHANPCLPTR